MTIIRLALACSWLLFHSTLQAQYPEKPIEIIVGFAAGGGTDVMARTVAPFLEKHLGSGATVVIRNVPGAGGQIGVTKVANAKPDGYTLGTFSLPGMMARTLDRKAGYTADSFTFIANIVNDANVIVTPKRSNLDSLTKLIHASIANPGALSVGISSLGGDDHFALLELQRRTGAEFNVVPFRGSAPARTGLIGGHVDVGVFNVSEIVSFMEQVNVLGVAQRNRSAFAPDVPTFAESGFDLTCGSMRGFVGPAGLPAAVESRLLSAFREMARDAGFIAAMHRVASPVDIAVGDEFRALNAEALEHAKQVWMQTPWR